jgi:4-diphosphocytidyl-2-C-methyl-D-erythritol kinase
LVEPIDLPPLAAVLVPQDEGLATAEVYAQLDRMEGWRPQLDLDRVRRLARDLPASLENDLQPAALALRPELAEVLDRLRAAGAPAAMVSGSGPTCFGLFADAATAERAAATIPGALTASLRAA